jgi:lysophospholipase L1-like esterase
MILRSVGRCRDILFDDPKGMTKPMQKNLLRLFAGLLCATIPTFVAGAQNKNPQGHWVTAWATAVHTPLPFPGLPPPPVFENQTVRMVIRATIGGTRLRIRLSNANGTSSLDIGAAHVAIIDHGAAISPQSDRLLKFSGQAAIEIPAGAPMLSDPVDLPVAAFQELAISLFLPRKTQSSTVHFWGQHDSYISEPSDFTAKTEIPDATVKTSWYYLADVEVWAPDQTAAIVALGDSITDGAGARQGEYGDWPDQLARRLAESHAAPMAVVNEGIGGNRILHDGAGINSLARLDRDVLGQPGVSTLIVLEGINDIGWPHMKIPAAKDTPAPKENPFAAEGVTADELIMGLQQMIDRAHQHGIRVVGATLTPYDGAGYFTPDGEAIRQAVNQWIRSSSGFDGVIDFDAAVRDPQYPTQFREAYHSGDHLHPNTAGYKAMADAIDLSMLKTVGIHQPQITSRQDSAAGGHHID